jgi:hypothetical protein
MHELMQGYLGNVSLRISVLILSAERLRTSLTGEVGRSDATENPPFRQLCGCAD